MKRLLTMGIISLMAQVTVAQLPKTGFVINERTAVVITDPQNDFMSEQGKGWAFFGSSVIKNQTREHIEQILKIAKEKNMLVFISPHYYYKTDHQWHFEGSLERFMHGLGMFERKGQLTGEGFEGSGADWYMPFKKYLDQSNVIISGPHKMYGPQNNDLALQLRKRGIDKVIICGMSGNLCSESHLRDLLEKGFETSVVFDATASAVMPDEGIDGNVACLMNFKMLASKVYQTDELLKELRQFPVNKTN